MVPGERLGPYEIVAPLRSGGMGHVYRARDTRLGRDVAIKLLLPEVFAHQQLRARFEREAQTLAALNHRHIAAIHDIVESGDQRAIVMEFVAGRPLDEVMASGAVPVRLALGYAIDICDALAAAHAAGVVHRDLKPANVVVTESGAVKVLDFGIAKIVGPGDVGATVANTMPPLTGDHTVVGTVGYMSPEQVHGRSVDARSDVFSLGVLLYEMMAGRRAFEGDSAAGVLSAVLRDDPVPLRTVVSSVPRSVGRIAARCLEKDPRQRYQTAVDLKRALEDARDDLATLTGVEPASLSGLQTPASQAPAPAPRRRLLPSLGYLAAGAGVAALGLMAAGAFQPAVILLPRHSPFVTEQPGAGLPKWAPDGRSVAYLAVADGSPHLFVRSLDADQPTQLTRGSASIEGYLGWSPDGTRVYFYRNGDLSSVGIAGGEPTLVARGPGHAGFAVGPDGRSVVSARRIEGVISLSVVDTVTGDERRLERQGLPTPLLNVGSMAFSPDGRSLGLMVGTTTNSPESFWIIPWPEGVPRAVLAGAPINLQPEEGFGWMPDSRRIVFNATPADEASSRLFLGDTVSGAVQQITAGANSEVSPTVSPDGARVAFVSQRLGRDLLALPVDGTTPQPVLQSSRNESFPDMSASGTLAYVTDADGWPAVRLRTGADAWSRRMGRNIENMAQVRLAPDGQRLSVDDFSGADHSIMIYAVAGGAPVRLDRETTDQHGASWSPDGNWLAYRRLLKDRWQLVKTPVGGGAAVVLADYELGGGGGATDWSASGAWIGHTMQPGGVHLVASDGKARRALAGPTPAAFRFSRDGSRLLAVRREGRRWELATWDVDSGREVRVVALPLAASTEIQGMALSPDESQVIVGAGAPTSDIWLLEQFEPPAAFWRRWFAQ